MKKLQTHIILFLLIALSACAPAQLAVQDPWARPAAAEANSAVYFTLDNPTAQEDTLLRAASGVASSVEIHQASMENDIMKMTPVETVTIPAGGQIEFSPGGLHLMLIDLNQTLAEGQQITLTLEFENAGLVEIQVPVEQR